MIHIGFIGCGQVTERWHLPALRSLAGVEVTALADPDDSRLQKESAKGFVTVGFNLRHHHLVVQVKKIICSGQLGCIQLIRSVACGNWKASGPVADWRKRVSSGGGVLLELGVHHFDLWRFLLESDIDDVSARNASNEHEDQTAVVSGRMKQGAPVSGCFAQSTADHNQLDINGEHGRFCVAGERFDGLRFISSGGQSGAAKQRLGNLLGGAKQLPAAVRRGLRRGGFADSYRNQWLALCDCISKNRAPETTADDGYAAVRARLSALGLASHQAAT